MDCTDSQMDSQRKEESQESAILNNIAHNYQVFMNPTTYCNEFEDQRPKCTRNLDSEFAVAACEDITDSLNFTNDTYAAEQNLTNQNCTEQTYTEQGSRFINSGNMNSTLYNESNYENESYNEDLCDGVKSSKRVRFKYTKEQIRRFEEIFVHNMFPDSLTREEISNELNIPTKNIQVWFKNRRAKHRKSNHSERSSYMENSTTLATPERSMHKQFLNSTTHNNSMQNSNINNSNMHENFMMPNPLYLMGSYNMPSSGYWYPNNYVRNGNMNNNLNQSENRIPQFHYLQPGNINSLYSSDKTGHNQLYPNGMAYTQLMHPSQYQNHIPYVNPTPDEKGISTNTQGNFDAKFEASQSLKQVQNNENEPHIDNNVNYVRRYHC